MFVANVHGNRTHQGRETPPIGFEDQARHQHRNHTQENINLPHQMRRVKRLKCGGASLGRDLLGLQ